MRIGCVYTVERAASREKPLLFAVDIPFGISAIATALEASGHNVDLFVFSRKSPYEKMLNEYIDYHRPNLFCLTAVSSQFAFIREIILCIKRIDPSIFVLLGGHHASLDPEGTIKTPGLSAICVGEGDLSVLQLAQKLEADQPITGIHNLWIRRSSSSIEKNSAMPFQQDLDKLPYINRAMWEPWIKEPNRFPTVLLGRGCPFSCTYCFNHAMRRLSKGQYTRFRSPENIVGEISQICDSYSNVDSIYLEVETIAHQKEAAPLFRELERFNEKRDKIISFGLNFTVTSAFIRNEDQCRNFLSMLKHANVIYMNIGLESGSESLRRDVLHRPKYSNADFLKFAQLAREYGIDLNLYVLIGFPGETLNDYKETISVVRQVRPKMVFLSIFYPYPGTDLHHIACQQGLISQDSLDFTAERALAVLDLPGFPRARVRLEYVLFWFKIYRGYWPLSKIFVEMTKSLIRGYPRLSLTYQFLQERSRVFRYLKQLYHLRIDKREARQTPNLPKSTESTYTE